MGLIQCPDCGKMVSIRVAACPNCGCPSEYFEKETSEESKVDTLQTLPSTETKIELPIQPEEKKICMPAPQMKDDIEFKFGRHIISYPKSTENIAALYGKYVKLAHDYSEKYVRLYNSAGDMHTVLTSLTNKVISDIVSLEDMAAEDLYDFGIGITRKEFDSEYIPEFKKEIESLFQQYVAVEQEKNDLEYQRQVEKASRGRWQGGGFGMKGAIKGAMNAAVLNAGSGLLHSIGDGFTKSGDRKYINSRFEAIYASEENRTEFVASALYCFVSVLEGIKSELHDKKLININIFGDYEEISSTYETAIKYEKSADILFEKMLVCIKASPEEIKYYEPITQELFKVDCELERFLKFWNLSWIYNELQKEYSQTLMKNIKSKFVTNLCSLGIKIVGRPESISDGVLVYGQVVKGAVSLNDEVSLVKNFATPIINASVIKILCGEKEVQKTNLGGEYGFVLSLKNSDSAAETEIIVNASSFKQIESNLYATYVSNGEITDFDFAKKYCGDKSAWHTFVNEDNYISNRNISFISSKNDIIKSYGETPTKLFIREKDDLLETTGSSNDTKRLETAKEYLQYKFGSQYAMRFYFDENGKMLLVAYLKNLGLSNTKDGTKEIRGFSMQIECTKCGKIIGSDKKFCSFCGEPNPIFMKKCPSCGKHIKKKSKFCNFCGQSFEFPDLNASSLKQENSNVCKYHVECEWDDGGEELQLFVSDILNSIDEFRELYSKYSIKYCAAVDVIPELPLNGIDGISFFEVSNGKDDEICLQTTSNDKTMLRTIKKSEVEMVVNEFITGQVLEGEFEELVY